jgi:heptosyltransferase-1
MNILIVKTSSLGDIIHAFPVLSYLKQKLPDCKIDFVVEKSFAELVLQHPLIDNVIEVNTKQWRKSFLNAYKGIKKFRSAIRLKKYDVSFDLQCNMKSGLIISQIRAKHKVGFGFKTAIEWPNCLFNTIHFNPPKICNVRDENLFLVKEYFNDGFKSFPDYKITLKISGDEKALINGIILNPKISMKPQVLVCPGSIWKNKQITQDAMKSFLKLLQGNLDCSFIFAWGSDKEKEYVEELYVIFSDSSLIIDKLSLPCLQNLMGKMQLVIAMDSLPLHLAGTTGVSTFSFFGPSSSSKYMPAGQQHHAFQGSCPYGRTIERRCRIIRTCETGACLRTVSGDVLFKAYLKQFNLDSVLE